MPINTANFSLLSHPNLSSFSKQPTNISLSKIICNCMAASFLARDVSDLCLGKPPLSPLPVTTTVADALSELKRSGESYVSVWSSSGYSDSGGDCKCVGKICTVDVICFLCREENIFRPYDALQFPISDILPKVPGIVRHLEPSSRFVYFFN